MKWNFQPSCTPRTYGRHSSIRKRARTSVSNCCSILRRFSDMKIYPAIDILGGKAVRLKQGRKSDATVYGDPREMATRWVNKGAEWLHVVDLDGAFEGEPRN